MTTEEQLAAAQASLAKAETDIVALNEQIAAAAAATARLAEVEKELNEAKASAEALNKQVAEQVTLIDKMKAEATTASKKAAIIVANSAGEPVPVAATSTAKSYEDAAAELKAIKDPKAKAEFFNKHIDIFSR